MSLGWPQLLVVALLVLLLFGRGKIADLMGELAKGVRNFRRGLHDEDATASTTKTPRSENDRPPEA